MPQLIGAICHDKSTPSASLYDAPGRAAARRGAFARCADNAPRAPPDARDVTRLILWAMMADAGCARFRYCRRQDEVFQDTGLRRRPLFTASPAIPNIGVMPPGRQYEDSAQARRVLRDIMSEERHAFRHE